ncbi:MAG: molybdopterin molybdotransferase MoeA [Deltaproteobacteria bacterium]|nr:molybdopterin molybdotransferase MoeA [Deltaproteobacteria bacterium]
MAAFSIEEAKLAVLENVSAIGIETVDLAAALGRALGAPIVSDCHVPPADNAGMDGIAVRWEDTRDASPERPVRLRLLGTIGAGQVTDLVVTATCAAKIMTGAAVPPGADAVIPVEDVEYEGAHAVVRRGARLGDHVRPMGEDVKAGQRVFDIGAELTSAHIGVLASLGVATVPVGKRPRVAIIATGSELVAVSQTPGRGQIRNSNSPALVAAAMAAGAIAEDLGHAPDDLAKITERLLGAVVSHDIVISSGGVSVGEFDFVKSAMKNLGVELRFDKVAQKPGKPMSYGRIGERTHVFGLPGNPAAALVCFHVYLKPLIRRLQGFADIETPMAWGRLVGRLASKGRPSFARVIPEATPEGYRVHLAGSQSSGLLLPMALGRALAHFPARDEPYADGDLVRFQFLDGGVG